MKRAKRLETLGDYRRVARESLFDHRLPVYKPLEENEKSPYHAVRAGLIHSRDLIFCSRNKTLCEQIWDNIAFLGTEYEMKNLYLFECVRLMEFSIKYNDVQSVDGSVQNWPEQPPGANIRVFTSAGVSYLEAASNFLSELGHYIVRILQNVHLRYTKGSGTIRGPVDFLRKTDTVDTLHVYPIADITIITWFDGILAWMQEKVPQNEYSQFAVEAEFNSAFRQLDSEWNTWKTPGGIGKQGPSDSRVDWKDEAPGYIKNKEAIELANQRGREHNVETLIDLDANRLNKLLRSCRGRHIKYMSRTKPPRGKVCQRDFLQYITKLIEQEKRIQDEAEKRVVKRLS